jgi:paraquat-inducible protein A
VPALRRESASAQTPQPHPHLGAADGGRNLLYPGQRAARHADTIMSGVIYFIKSGMWPIALVIFVASICVPLVKLLILSFLLISVHRHSSWRPKERTRFYRLTEAVGRWSMVDIYVITISVALVRLGAVARFEAGPGIVFFAAVVVFTMLAAMSFDPRLIWDNKESRNDRRENRNAPD